MALYYLRWPLLAGEAFFANRLGEGAVEILDVWRARLAGPKGAPTAREDLLLQACEDL